MVRYEDTERGTFHNCVEIEASFFLLKSVIFKMNGATELVCQLGLLVNKDGILFELMSFGACGFLFECKVVTCCGLS